MIEATPSPAWSWVDQRRSQFILLAVAVIVWMLRNYVSSAAGVLALVAGNAVHGFVGLSVFSGFGGFRYMNQNWSVIAGYFGEHLRLSVEALAYAIAIALPVGIIVNRFRWLYVPTFTVLDGIYTIPSLALFVVLLSRTGISDATVLIALVAYAQFILVRNVVVGLEGVPAEVKEAARGMGMNSFQILTTVELPLALPVIVAGLRLATVATISIASIAAFIAIPDLGTLFVNATTNGGVNAYPEIEAGAVAVTGLALGADLVLRAVERFIPANRVGHAGRPSKVQVPRRYVLQHICRGKLW